MANNFVAKNSHKINVPKVHEDRKKAKKKGKVKHKGKPLDE